MNFSKKLDTLMNITKTSNSLLARSTALDASYISRLRRGERDLPRKANYIEAMAAHFAKHCLDGYQRKALADLIPAEEILTDEEDGVRETLVLWLKEYKSEGNNVAEFLDKLSNYQPKKNNQPEQYAKITNAKGTDNETQIYYGIEGKREAVLNFLSQVLQVKGKPLTLLLFSDEGMAWMKDSPEFVRTWSNLMLQVILKGHRITIIHTVSRHLDEMLSAIEGWMPLYMTGAVEPYFYPKKRDGVFKRTIFIAPENCAVVSTSVGNMEESAANFFLKGKKAVAAIGTEYTNYLALCRPLMRIFTRNEKADYFNTLLEFEKEKANSIVRTGSLSVNTIPKEVIPLLVERISGDRKNAITSYVETRTYNFKNHLLKNRYVEIISLPDMERIKNGKVKILLSDLLEVEGLYYRPDEYRLHLENIVSLLNNYENYHVCIDEDFKEDSYMLYVREDIGVIVAKTSMPPTIMAFNESNMSAAFWDFLNNQLDYSADCNLKRKNAITRLQEVINELKQD